MIKWAFFPFSERPTELAVKVVDVFKSVAEDIDSSLHDSQPSNIVLKRVTDGLTALEFAVETGKRKSQKIHVPVLFGLNGSIEKSFEADAYHEESKFILEVEAGRAVTNYQFLKDLFQACMMKDVEYLGVAVRNRYRNSNDFKKVFTFFDILYKSDRMKLPLRGVLLIGY